MSWRVAKYLRGILIFIPVMSKPLARVQIQKAQHPVRVLNQTITIPCYTLLNNSINVMLCFQLAKWDEHELILG
jgi:hypothetical protein